MKQLILKQSPIYFDVQSGDLSDTPFTWYDAESLVEADVVMFDDADEMMKVLFSNNIQHGELAVKYFPDLIDLI